MRYRTVGPLVFATTLAAFACATPSDRTGARSIDRASALQPTSALDPRVQRIARSELDRIVEEWQPEGAVIVVLDVATGSVLAMEGRDHGRDDPTIASQRAFVTGSTLKAFTIATALDQNTIAPDARLDCQPRPYGMGELHDPQAYGVLSVAEVMATSSNVGTSRIFDTLGLARLEPSLRNFHIGDPPGMLPRVEDDASIKAVVLAIGELARATPLQVAAGYRAIFDGGEYVVPSIVRTSFRPERVLRTETAQLVTSMLEGAVSGELATGKLARIPGKRVAGKTGTGEMDGLDGERVYASFVGSVLDHEPRFVTLVGIVAPGHDGSGPSAAAPAFARLSSRLMTERHDSRERP